MEKKIAPQWFMKKFRFNSQKVLTVGCERELFLTNSRQEIQPLAVDALKKLGSDGFSYELSECQLEMHIGPVQIYDFEQASLEKYLSIRELLSTIGIGTKFITVAPSNMPLNIYPDPTGRYQIITEKMPREILSAACRVAGTHFHIGMPDYDTALKVYNRVLEHYDKLCDEGNLTQGERMQLYHQMAKDYKPRHYGDWDDLYTYYHQCGYDFDPRKCWHLIRISVNGTIEFRMFDNTENLDQVTQWAKRCHSICANALY